MSTTEQFTVYNAADPYGWHSDPFDTFPAARAYADKLERQALRRAYPMVESYGVQRAVIA